MRIDHINISASLDLIEHEKQFFCELLGFEEGFRPPFERYGYWLYADGKALVHLVVSKEEVETLSKSSLDHIAFQTTGLDDFIKRLDAKDVRYQCDYVEAFEMTQLFMKSPSGVEIEVNFVKESIQAKY